MIAQVGETITSAGGATTVRAPIHVAGSVRSDRDVAAVIHGEIERGGLRNTIRQGCRQPCP